MVINRAKRGDLHDTEAAYVYCVIITLRSVCGADGQVENEYGYYGDVSKNRHDRTYMEYLIDQCRHYLGANVILYTTDGWPMELMKRGSLNGSAVLTLG